MVLTSARVIKFSQDTCEPIFKVRYANLVFSRFKTGKYFLLSQDLIFDPWPCNLKFNWGHLLLFSIRGIRKVYIRTIRSNPVLHTCIFYSINKAEPTITMADFFFQNFQKQIHASLWPVNFWSILYFVSFSCKRKTLSLFINITHNSITGIIKFC